MINKSSLINVILTFLLTVGTALTAILIGSPLNTDFNTFLMILMFVGGAVLWGVVITFLHELGHVALAKKNGFEILSVSILFFKWTKTNNKFEFSFTFPFDEMGSVEIVSKTTHDLEKRYKMATLGSLIFTIPLIIIGVVPYCLTSVLPFYVFAPWSMMLPIALYSVIGNGFPTISNGACNDGGVILSLNKKTQSINVCLSLLAIQSELLQGKTPGEIDEKYYFDLPQLPEDDINFIMLLNARYNYYLDKNDYENAKKSSDRLMTLLDYMPKSFINIVKADALFNACTFDKNDTLADDLMYELDKFLNKNNTSTNVRIKLAYILTLEEDLDKVDLFYKKGIKEANKCQIQGLGRFETKLLDKLVSDK